MAESSKFENLLLDPKDIEKQERTFLGGLRLRARSNLFRIMGFVSLFILGVIFVRIDQHIVTAVDDWKAARDLLILVSRTQSGLARAEALERTYFLDHKRELVNAFSDELSGVDKALVEFQAVPQSRPVRPKIATLRDGIDQYNREFTQFVAKDNAVSLRFSNGVNPKLQELTTQLNQDFQALALSKHSEQLALIMDQGSEFIRAKTNGQLPAIQESYQILFGLLKNAKVKKLKKSEIEETLRSHQALLRKTINDRFIQETKRQQLSEVLIYIASSADALSRFATKLDVTSTRRLEQTRRLSRYTIAGSTAAILLWFIFAGILIFRSVVNPIQALASTAGRIANGERNVKIWARGNVDASGQIARALGKWIEDLADADMVRDELEHVRANLEITYAEADRRVEAATESAKAALHLERTRLEPSPEVDPTTMVLNPGAAHLRPIDEKAPVITPAVENANSGGPIRYISQQLTHFSDYVTAAAQDVERTEALIRHLNEANSHLEIFGKLLSTVQGKVNVLISELLPRVYPSDGSQNRFASNSSDRRQGDHPILREHTGIDQLNEIQATTDQADKALHSIRQIMFGINAIAQEIAKTASDQALEATNKLLSQSQHLQQILDDIMSKINIDNTSSLSSSPSFEEDDMPESSKE